MLQQQAVAIFLVLVFRTNAYQAANFFLVQTHFLPTDGCYATEPRVLRRKAQKLKPVISESHYVLSVVTSELTTTWKNAVSLSQAFLTDGEDLIRPTCHMLSPRAEPSGSWALCEHRS